MQEAAQALMGTHDFTSFRALGALYYFSSKLSYFKVLQLIRQNCYLIWLSGSDLIDER
jgi:tRNA U38,U39,U40 pseudouridine synthase TruA